MAMFSEHPNKKYEALMNEFRMMFMNEDTECGNEILCTLLANKCVQVVCDEALRRYDYWEEVQTIAEGHE
jgi:hypothetical protein